MLKYDAPTMLYPSYWFSDIKGRVLGLLALTMGEADTAVGYFDECYQFCREEGLKPILAWICYDYARALISRGIREDDTFVQHLLDEGLIITTSLGMRPLESRLVDLLVERNSTCSDQIAECPTWQTILSHREGEVLRFVARGYKNREIGELLFISERTVANHMRNILTKLGASNRAEATAWAIRNGIEGDLRSRREK